MRPVGGVRGELRGAGGGEGSFSPELFEFLRDLKRHNDRGWFTANRDRYFRAVREPALDFIADFAPLLQRISRQFTADARPVGGSLFRIHRDTRFSRDKAPYKTHVGIQFRHHRARDAHAPGFYLHLEPGSVFAALGVWHPDRPTLARIRDTIAADPRGWRKAAHGPPFAGRFTLGGDSLRRAPAGHDPGHPLIEDLRRTDFIGICALSEEDVLSRGFPLRFAAICRDGAGFVRFLCRALDLPF